jgi:hypothetical protein
MYTHISKGKNDKIKERKKEKNLFSLHIQYRIKYTTLLLQNIKKLIYIYKQITNEQITWRFRGRENKYTVDMCFYCFEGELIRA